PTDAELLRAPDDATGEERLLVVAGGDRARRALAAVLRAQATVLLRLRPPTSGDAWAAVVREATISGLGVLLEVDDDLPELARWWIERADHLPWVVSSPAELPIDRLPRRGWVET